MKKDPKFSKIILDVGEYKIRKTRNYFQSLVEVIVTQQLSGSAANSIISKFREIYGSRFPRPIDVIKTPVPKLRKSGLSRMKISYIKDLSKRVESGEIVFRKIIRMQDEEIISELTRVKGIGRWTAEMFLIFSLGREDVLPVDDLGLKKGFKALYSLEELPQPEKMEKIAEKWRPYRTVATWYLWKSLKNFDTIG